MTVLTDLEMLNELKEAAYAEGFVAGLRAALGLAQSGSEHAASRLVESSNEYWRGRLSVADSINSMMTIRGWIKGGNG